MLSGEESQSISPITELVWKDEKEKLSKARRHGI